MLEDVQARRDERGITVDRAGVSGLRWPLTVSTAAGHTQAVLAEASLSVRLRHDVKGAHMSRFVEVLRAVKSAVTLAALPRLAETVCDVLHSEAATVRLSFPFVLERHAPVTGSKAFVDYLGGFAATREGSVVRAEQWVRVPVMTLCPCSKAISDYGAHNQRGLVTVTVEVIEPADAPSLEEQVAVAEACGSSPIYALLKRSDERHVTMKAHDNPMFVEDVVREVAARLMQDARVAAFGVRVVNDESIHNHEAFAEVAWNRERDTRAPTAAPPPSSTPTHTA